METQKAFGRKVQQLRKELGLSQEKFALSIDMDRTYLASVEAGKRNISLRNIEKIANGFHITLAELFENLKKIERRDHTCNSLINSYSILNVC